MTDFMRGPAEEQDVATRGYASLNNSVITQALKPDFSLSPARIDPERDVVIGSASTPAQYNAAKGGYDLTGERFSFESANLVRYRPGGLSYAGTAVVIPSDPPAGQLDIGLGGVPYEDWVQNGTFAQYDGEITLRLTANGDWALVIRRDNDETIIPRDPDAASWQGTPAEGRSWIPGQTDVKGDLIDDQTGTTAGRYWALDACDGSGPGGDGGNRNRSSVDLDQRPLMILPKLIGTWYGKGPYYLTFETAASGGFQRAFPAVAFEAEQQSISTRASLPLMVRYDDDGAGQSFDMEVYGRQGSGAGPTASQPKTPWNVQTGLSYGASFDNASLLLAYRRAPEDAVTADVNFRGTVFGLLRLSMFTSSRSIVFSAFDIDFGGQTPDWTTPTSESNQADVSIQVADQDTGGGDLTADPTTGTIQEATQVSASTSGSGAARTLDPIQQPNARTQPTGVFAWDIGGNGVSDADLLTIFQEEGA